MSLVLSLVKHVRELLTKIGQTGWCVADCHRR